MSENTWRGDLTIDGQSVTEWILRGYKRPLGRQRTRWCDDFIKYLVPTWSHIAKDWKLWKARGGVPP